MWQVLGLDCEWVSNDQSRHMDGMSARRPVSLLQLASVSGVCVLVRLHLLQYIPDSLQQLLVDRRWYASISLVFTPNRLWWIWPNGLVLPAGSHLSEQIHHRNEITVAHLTNGAVNCRPSSLLSSLSWCDKLQTDARAVYYSCWCSTGSQYDFLAVRFSSQWIFGWRFALLSKFYDLLTHFLAVQSP